MGRRKCTRKQLAAPKIGREIAHRRSKYTTKVKVGSHEYAARVNRTENTFSNLPLLRH